MLHRDVKPENVMLGAFGEVYLMDWGCACPADTRTTRLVGTPCYAAPEMLVRGAQLGPYTDVFLLGATLHRLVTGAHRHVGASVDEVLRAAAAGEHTPYPAHLSSTLVALLDRACALDPAARSPTAAAFAEAVRGWRRHREAEAAGARALEAARAVVASLGVDEAAASRALTRARDEARAAWVLWPECPEAHAAWTLAHEAFVPARLARGDVAWVEAMVADGRPEDVARWSDALADARRRVETERQRLHAVDLAFAARERAQAMFALLVATLVAVLVAAVVIGPRPLTPADVAGLGVVGFVLVVGAFVPFRERIFGNHASRSLMLGILLVVAMSALHRVGAWLAGAPPSQTLGADALLHAMGIAMLSLQLDARLAVSVVPNLVSAVAINRWPELAGAIYPVGTLTSVGLGALAFRRAARRGATASRAGP